jgi:putative peptidoglycan lipid II flippase
MAKLWTSAAVAAAAAWVVKLGIGHGDHPIKAAVVILGTYGVVYFAATYGLRVEECAKAFRRLRNVGKSADAAR